ncbi:MAG TPA: uroporphyrinogen decarboxylase family protein [Planctomycetota bacterium]|nr:uroporphyrinogen decarboxylase family protein [Planctomycetota bacterium]
MSYERGIAAIRLQAPAEIPHTQYITHPKLEEALAGVPRESPEFGARLAKALDLDFFWYTDGPGVSGKHTDMGHCVWQADGSDFHLPGEYAFKTTEEALSLDPVAEYGLPDIRQQAERYQAWWKESQAKTDGVLPGGLYMSLFSFCIHTFGWETFLAAAAEDEERFDKILDGYFKIIMAYTQAWAKTDIEVFLTHDDIVWTAGPVFRPQWYRDHVFPRYKKYWEVMRNAGKTVLFCSDGNFDEFVDDLAAAGTQGFIFEPLTSLENIVRKYGKTHVIMGNADTRILTFSTRDAVRTEVQRCMRVGRDCPGFFFAVGNHIPPNVPVENAMECLDEYKRLRKRR